MATLKLAIWPARNDVPVPINAQKAATSRTGSAQIALERAEISFCSGRRAHFTEFRALLRLRAGGPAKLVGASAPIGNYISNDT